jgi:hypothetical protein
MVHITTSDGALLPRRHRAWDFPDTTGFALHIKVPSRRQGLRRAADRLFHVRRNVRGEPCAVDPAAVPVTAAGR